MADWVEDLKTAIAQGPVALVSLLAVEGSTPREAGVRMVVSAGRIWGTIGGGNLEYRAIDQARAALDRPAGTWAVQDYPLGPLLGQCCGGRVRLLVEHLDPAGLAWLADAREGRMLVSRLTPDAILRRVADDLPQTRLTARAPRPEPGAVLVERIGEARTPLLLFGAGHVGQAIARAAQGLPFALTWFDSRPDVAGEGLVHPSQDDLPTVARDAPAASAVLILTHDHALDYRLAQAALSGPARFVGLIGSKTKRARFVSRLRAADPGLDPSRLVCPIGLPMIGGKAPEVIAISVLAQLLALRTAAVLGDDLPVAPAEAPARA
jgi:xanthine dehydrogenase accessory factor